MLTLKELKKIVKVADVEKRIPSVKSLKEHKVVVKEMINADTTISVYDHGYVLYTAGNQSTVFPLHSCDDYEYVSVTGDNKESVMPHPNIGGTDKSSNRGSGVHPRITMFLWPLTEKYVKN